MHSGDFLFELFSNMGCSDQIESTSTKLLAFEEDGVPLDQPILVSALPHFASRSVAGNWTITPAGLRGTINDALAIYFLETALANAFVARWCLGYRVETYEGSFRLRDDEPSPRIAAPQHRMP